MSQSQTLEPGAINELPAEGVIVSPPTMAKAIASGEKTLLVKSRTSDFKAQDYLLISLRKALGVVRLGECVELDDKTFGEREDEHLITKSLRDEWTEAQPSWGEGPLYAWPVEVVEKFEEPRDTNVKSEPHAVVRDVVVEEDEQEVAKAIWGSPAGKTKIAKRIVAMLHSHTTYVEPFVGSGAVLFEKEPSKVEAVNDADPEIAESFRTLKGITAAQLSKLKKKSWVGDKQKYASLVGGKFKDAIDKLYRFLYMAHFSYGKLRKKSFNPGAQGVQANTAERVEKMAPRLKNVQVFSGDYVTVVKKFDGANTTFFLDPPYPGYNVSVGESKFDEEQFHQLLKGLKGKFLITYGIRGKFPAMARKTKGFYIKQIRPARSIRTMRGVGGPKFLTQLVITNYEPISKADDDELIVEDWTKAMEDAVKIEDVDNYDPAEAKDNQLRDDFRILLAWYASWKKDPDEFEHSLETIEKLLRKVIKELVSRGAKVIQFNPRGMKAGVRQFFLQVARDVKVPEAMYKALTLEPDMDPDDLTAEERLLAHWQLHKMFDKEVRSQRGKKAWSTEDLVNLHARLVDKMGKHPPPPDNGLDELSEDFESGAAKRPKWHEAPSVKTLKAVGEFFSQPKPTKSASPEQLQTVENFVALYEDNAENWLPAYVQKKYDGANYQIHKNGDSVKIISEDGDDNTDRLPGIVKAVKALKPSKLILTTELEKWDGSQHLPRETVTGYINSKEAADDSALVANVYDVLYSDEDLHGKPTSKRLEALDKLGIKQSTMGAPDLKQRLNAAPNVKVNDLEQLEKAVQKIRKLPGSEGVVCKQDDAPYPIKKTTSNAWVKFRNATTVRGIVIGRTKTKAGVWIYQYGVLPGKEEAETVSVKEKAVVPIGDSSVTKLSFDAGDGILVEAATINLERSPGGVKLSAWVPRVIGELKQKTDTVDTVAARAKSNLVLQQKDVDDDGNVTYKPTGNVEKQKDPYLVIPSEDKKYKYSVQHHWRGKNVHSDLRIEHKPKQLLLGWTLNTQIKGAAKEPVTTLAEARAWSKRMNEISKINWDTGEWAGRPKAGTDKLVRTEILSERKAPGPWAWLGVEGKTKDPEPGKAPPVGGTRQFPGVFEIVDQGTAEYGAQKPWFHEYFFRGDGLNYRMFFRLLKISKSEDAGDCEACNTDGATTMMGWGGKQPARLCDECAETMVSKADVVLPPSEEQPIKDQSAWLAIYPDDQTPYVLGNEAVKKGWMPPDGYSALPEAVRSQVPSQFKYWKKKGEAAKRIRDELVAAVKKEDVKLDYDAPFKKTEKKTMADADFVLQEQSQRESVQARVGSARTKWWVRLDVGRKELLVLDLQRNPLDNKTVAVRVTGDKHKDSMELSGSVPPGHYLNPAKENSSNIEGLDSGKAEVLALSDDLIKIRFSGKKLKGLYAIKRNNAEWLWGPSKAGPKVKITEKKVEFDLVIPFDRVEIQKKDGKERRLITGIVLEPNVVDAQNDWENPETIERAAHLFLSNYNRPQGDGGTQLGVMHKVFGDVGIELVESYIAYVAFKLGKKKVKKGSWVVTVHVSSDKRWKEVKDGKLNGFSVGGVASVAGN